MLTLDELAGEVETGAIDTVIVAFTDMQGRLMGKRLHGEYFVEEIADGHEVEGCDYLLALDMEMDPIPGYEIASWEQGYGDFELKPDLDTLRRIPWLEATALVLCDVQWHDGSPVQPSPRQVLRAQVERAAALGLEPMLGSELEFYLLRQTFAGGLGAALREPHALGPVHPRLPHPRRDLRREAHQADPERDARRRDPGRDLEGRGLAGPARDQLPLRRRAPHGGQPRDLQERGEGDRLRQRLLDHVHGEAVRVVDRQLVPRARLALPRRLSRVRDGRRALRPLPRRADRRVRGARDLPRADDQLVQALRGRELGADHARVGEGQPDVRVPRRRPRRRRGASRRGSRAGTSTRISPSRRSSRPACTGSSRSSSPRRRSRGTRTSPTRSGSRRRFATRSPRSSPGRSRARRSATRSSTTT